MHREHTRRYARLLVEHAVALRPDQRLFVRCETVHRRLALAIAEAAYDLGAAAVDHSWSEPLEKAMLVRRARPEAIAVYHQRDQSWFNEVVRTRSPVIMLVGEEFPQLAAELARSHPEASALFVDGASDARLAFQQYGIGRRLCPWVLAAAATPGWAQRVFPGKEPEEAEKLLAEWIFTFTGADRRDAGERLAAKARRLAARARWLDELAIRELRLYGGNSDLRIALSPRARWQSTTQQTVWGQSFHPNMPSEEIFTTPDRRLTHGRLAASMPFRVPNGVLVKDLVLRFRRGRVVEFAASAGKEAFARYLERDAGARYLGEVALVARDSPIARSGLFFDKFLLDENAASHVALGRGFPLALAGGESMSARQLEELGCNHSKIHTDIMFGSPEVSIAATLSRHGEVVLVDRGEWARWATQGSVESAWPLD